MDAEDQVTVCSHIAELGMQVVGWYHSHPVFITQPSVTDIRNQWQQQGLWETGELQRAPFVGVIVGPYAEDLAADHQSDFRW
jgi:hypothetical protein